MQCNKYSTGIERFSNTLFTHTHTHTHDILGNNVLTKPFNLKIHFTILFG